MEAPNQLTKVIEKEKNHCLRDITHMINFSPLLNDRIQIVSISPISSQERSKLHLEPPRDVDLEEEERPCDENCDICGNLCTPQTSSNKRRLRNAMLSPPASGRIPLYCEPVSKHQYTTLTLETYNTRYE